MGVEAQDEVGVSGCGQVWTGVNGQPVKPSLPAPPPLPVHNSPCPLSLTQHAVCCNPQCCNFSPPSPSAPPLQNRPSKTALSLLSLPYTLPSDMAPPLEHTSPTILSPPPLPPPLPHIPTQSHNSLCLAIHSVALPPRSVRAMLRRLTNGHSNQLCCTSGGSHGEQEGEGRR